MSAELLEAHDGYAPVRNALRRMSAERGHWAGLPMPIEDAPLVVEPKYPGAAKLMQIGRETKSDDESQGCKLRNRFWSTKLHSDVAIWTDRDGALQWGIQPGIHHAKYDITTMAASVAWGIEQESNALQLLAELLPHHAFKKYLLTGMFLETSPRSRVTYWFRKLKPTIALHAVGDEMRILCALCLHPIAYYEGSWSGAMCPTDDVIAHLTLMRGNEHLFWRRANQHPAYRPEAGL